MDRLVVAGGLLRLGRRGSAMAGQEVYVIGGANSAAQAALRLARYAASACPST